MAPLHCHVDVYYSIIKLCVGLYEIVAYSKMIRKRQLNYYIYTRNVRVSLTYEIFSLLVSHIHTITEEINS